MSKPIISLTSLQNDQVKAMAALLEKKHRDRTGQFIIEGVHLVQEAIQAGADVRTIVYDGERGIPVELAQLLQEMDCELIEATKGIMAKCSGTDTPPPIFGIVAKMPYEEEALYKENSLVVVLDGVRDPGNVGTIIRSADAVGADAVVLGSGSVDLYNPKTVRSTMGSLFHLPIIEGNLEELLPEAKKRGIRLVGTSLQASATCYGYDWSGPTWLLLGNESNGLSTETLELVDENVIIPMQGKSESLNVAMAGTVLLYESLRQRKFNETIIPVPQPK
ncbi:23S rRNA methyltransferase [Paenibacillus baekrokdamisoli]|uniref:23S rRNA methyltransferase n=1 Tax=Paenibacillus baekrokdamisoli TaxID=1712516 RepID=A0A3G9JNV3_9BACL|nr:TrmH family RNA methyltransferase [Paenibacillus baekrokdamisoli]BBH24729.1 23S rRNA methyltransferase [Paenibacillus baekrokdamisoli]